MWTSQPLQKLTMVLLFKNGLIFFCMIFDCITLNCINKIIAYKVIATNVVCK